MKGDFAELVAQAERELSARTDRPDLVWKNRLMGPISDILLGGGKHRYNLNEIESLLKEAGFSHILHSRDDHFGGRFFFVAAQRSPVTGNPEKKGKTALGSTPAPAPTGGTATGRSVSPLRLVSGDGGLVSGGITLVGSQPEDVDEDSTTVRRPVKGKGPAQPRRNLLAPGVGLPARSVPLSLMPR